MCCSTACKAISEHYKTAGKDKEAVYFHELHEWFMSFYHATSDVFRAVMQIEVWSEEMLVGLTNFLNETFKYYGVFEWILSGLYKVVDDPLVKEKVFDHYIGIFTKSRDKLRRQKNKDGADDLTAKLKNLRKLAKGQSV